MKTKVRMGIVTLLVITAGVLGYATHPQMTPQPASPTFLSQQQVTADIQKQQLQQSKMAQDIRVIHRDTIGSEGFAFATFDVNGKQQFASVIMSRTGYSMSTFTMGTDKAVPIQYVTQRSDGFEYVTGGVFHHPNVKSAVLIWSDGTATTVPVQSGLFWYEHRVQIPADAYVKQVIGVTSSGAIVQSQINKGQ